MRTSPWNRLPGACVQGNGALVIAMAGISHPGWTPINSMARLGARLFEADLVDLNGPKGAKAYLNAYGRSRRRDPLGPDLLVITGSPFDLVRITALPGWRTRYNRVAAWIVDSFWVERMPPLGLSHLFDAFFVTTGHDRGAWEAKTRVPTSILPLGADALDLGRAGEAERRPVDLLRVGRQPTEWDDDEDTARRLSDVGLSYKGRPAWAGTAEDRQSLLMAEYGRSKFTVAFSNRAHASAHTHSHKEYVTCRWMDALAAGCIVAGIAPQSDWVHQNMFWPGATVEFPSTRREDAIACLLDMVAGWTPEAARHTRRMALTRLDWRLRFREIAKWFEIKAPKLDADLVRLSETAGRLAHAPQGVVPRPASGRPDLRQARFAAGKGTAVADRSIFIS